MDDMFTHMYTHIFCTGSLTVYSKRHGVYYTLWMMNGHQSSEWSQAVVEVNTKDITEVRNMI